MANEFAIKLGKRDAKHPLSRKWYYGFMKRMRKIYSGREEDFNDPQLSCETVILGAAAKAAEKAAAEKAAAEKAAEEARNTPGTSNSVNSVSRSGDSGSRLFGGELLRNMLSGMMEPTTRENLQRQVDLITNRHRDEEVKSEDSN